ncbi:hypothetical protein ACFOGI_09590 [Virgibacillus xinjiangensis]|uniref:Uncharacterized protein n=1 Tax=Virgibacillus xinjiangensis TaxID=393090 RepID=A0ABV7CVY5_9BACI
MFKKDLLKWLPRKDQVTCERKLIKVMKRLRVRNFNFNWDRKSCFIEFRYQETSYRLEHSIEKAKKRGIFLNNGLDCLMELTKSLEDLCGIIERGTYPFEAWIAGMAQPAQEEDITEYEEEFHIRYRSTGKQNSPEYHHRDQLGTFDQDSPLRFDHPEQILQTTERK